jgi:hypothetical protein
MPKQPPQTGWEKQAKVALRDGDALTALRTLEGASLHAKLQPRFPYFYAQPGGSGACEVLSNVSHREINFERLTCCQFAQILTQMRQLVGVIFSYAGSVLKAIAVRLHALGIKIVPEFAYRMPDLIANSFGNTQLCIEAIASSLPQLKWLLLVFLRLNTHVESNVCLSFLGTDWAQALE